MSSSIFGSLASALRAVREYGLGEVELQDPWSLLGLVVVGLVLVVLWRGGQPPVLVISRGEALIHAARRRGLLAPRLARAALGLVLVLVVVSMARPRVLAEPNADEDEGIDIVVAIDVSGSMRAADFKPRDRLTVAKKVIGDHILTRERDRIGLVVFAGEAFTQAPLTHDTRLLAEILEGVRTGVVTDGTAIGDAVATSVNRLRDTEAESKVVILVTDGDNNAGNLSPEKAAELAASFDVVVFPILVGRGGQVPFPQGTDFFGATRYVYIDTPTNPALLKRIAATTGGRFFSAEDPRALEESLLKILEEMDRTKLESGPIVRERIDLYPVLALLALLLLVAVFGWSTTRGSTLP